MEHARFEYSPIASRPVLKMPRGARVAVWVTPNIEHFRWGKPAISLTPMTAGLNPDVLNYAWRDYGARVGVWRLMEIFDKHGFKATAALNSDVCARYPEIVSAGNALGWEWMAHGESNSALFTGLPEEAERPIIQNAIDTIAQATGRKPRGWLGPALTETASTLDLLAEAGIEYVADWCNDELPYRMQTRSRPIVAMPYTLEIGDIPLFLERGGDGEGFYRMVVDQLEQLHAEGAKRPRVMSIAIHPFLIGHPFRARYLDKALRYIKRKKGVWIATAGEILDWWNKASKS
ncbi:MAG TPA: polysaccharide deacetylase family protein [Burkholderiales bacterium]|nr:polysaccharide deacetylase family protein [Burkholderiales bacterium]